MFLEPLRLQEDEAAAGVGAHVSLSFLGGLVSLHVIVQVHGSLTPDGGRAARSRGGLEAGRFGGGAEPDSGSRDMG